MSILASPVRRALTHLAHSRDTGHMADIGIRNVPDWLWKRITLAHTGADTCLEEELRGSLTEGALRGRRVFAPQAKAFRDTLRRKYGELPDSTPGIREDREARG